MEEKETQKVEKTESQPSISEDAIMAIVEERLRTLKDDVDKRFGDLLDNYHKTTNEIKESLPKKEIDDNDDSFNF